MSANSTQVAFEPVSEIPESASVCHLDEIGDSLQESLVFAEEQNQPAVTIAPIQAALIDECDCDIIKFTNYYRMSPV
jgi:hypothetical protein